MPQQIVEKKKTQIAAAKQYARDLVKNLLRHCLQTSSKRCLST